MISILHPSRQRPEKSYATAQKWVGNAGCDVELIVSVDTDNYDAYINTYSHNWFLDPNGPQRKEIIINDNRSAIDAINNAAKVAKGDILIVVSDDSDCPRNWGQKIIEATQHKKDWILKVNDGIQRWLITMPIMDRVYYSRFGYIYFPEYEHMFSDCELSHVADLLGRRIKRDDLSFPHRHYSVTRERKDEVSIKADSTWNQGKQLYLQRVKQSFGLKGVDVMSISDNSHYKWLKQNLK